MDLAPILVTSPVPRAGTTLVQRLLCSSSNTLIFGETAASDLQVGLHLATIKRTTLSMGAANHADMVHSVEAGDVNRWIADLLPPLDGYLAAVETAALGPVEACRAYAREQGRELWGAKIAGFDRNLVDSILNILPAAKVVYVLRDLADCLRSAKTVGLVPDLDHVRGFCAAWTQGMRFSRERKGHPRFLTLSLDALTASPERSIDALQQFTGAQGIDASVLDHRINTDPTDPRVAQGTAAHVAPTPLTPDEEAVVAEAVAELG